MKAKKTAALFCAALLLLGLAGCGKKQTNVDQEALDAANAGVIQQSGDGYVYEIKINMNNLWDYFEYKEYVSRLKEDDGTVTCANVAYGLQLKEGFQAANDENHKDTLKLTFTANGTVNEGHFTVDFDTLQWTGDVISSEQISVSDELEFWAKGNRTSNWQFGVYSTGYVNYFTDFTITSATGSIWLTS